MPAIVARSAIERMEGLPFMMGMVGQMAISVLKAIERIGLCAALVWMELFGGVCFAHLAALITDPVKVRGGSYYLILGT